MYVLLNSGFTAQALSIILDSEVVTIKMAERLHNMRTIDYIDDSKKTAKAKETIEIYLPLARRINNQKLIDELNHLALKYNV